MKIILITPGDPEGIGPEIVSKALRARDLPPRGYRLVCVGATEPFRRLGVQATEIDEAALDSPGDLREDRLLFLPAPIKAPSSPLFLPGYQSGWSVEKAARLVLAGKARALVTGPINKQRLQRGGYRYSGHTDFLAELCGVPQVTMMLANDHLRVTLATVHLALKDVPSALTRERLQRTIENTVSHLRDWWAIRKPRIAVAGLNPHAGEAGLFGDEEIRVISPVLQLLRQGAGGDFEIHGPLPADTLFANHVLAKREKRFDAVVCMYHDQGLIPVKLLDFRKTVNVTLGLPIVRTSVDHGTAFDIVGKNLADPASLRSAIDLAVEIDKKRGR